MQNSGNKVSIIFLAKAKILA